MKGGRCCPSAKALGYDQGKSGYALEPRRAIELANSSRVTCHFFKMFAIFSIVFQLRTVPGTPRSFSILPR